MRCRTKEQYRVHEKIDRIAPDWLAERLRSGNIYCVYGIKDGREYLKGVMVDHEMAKVGTVLLFDGKRVSIKMSKNIDER